MSHVQALQNSPSLWIKEFPFPKRDDNKYSRGHLLICGGPVMTGATRLAARAAQRVGAGLVTLAAPQSVVDIYALSLESVIVKGFHDRQLWHDLVNNSKINSILIGPGLGLGSWQKDCVLTALASKKLCVLDADALNNFSDQPEVFFTHLHEQCVLTPHEGEYARLFGQSMPTTAPKGERVKEAANRAGCTVLIKGADTYIADPHGVLVVNNNAPPWLATAGSGDVLSGLIAGLVAQKMPVLHAAAAGAYLHGQSASNFGPGLIAEDLILGIPPLLKSLSEARGIV